MAWALFLLALIPLVSYLHLRTPRIVDGDALYHFGHASVLAQNGIFDNSFPWVTRSVISVYNADIWWGFHLLMIPFTFVSDPQFGVKLVGIFVTAMMMAVFAWAMIRAKAVWPFFWPFLLLLMSQAELWRLTMIRPHVASLGFMVLLAIAIGQRSWKLSMAAGFAITFLHQTLSWMVVIIVGAMVVAQLLCERHLGWRSVLAAFLGSAIPWVARPNPIGAYELMKIQIVELSVVKKAGLPLDFGTELAKMDWPYFWANFWPFFIFWCLCALALIVVPYMRRAPVTPAERTLLWGNLLLSAGLYALTMGFSRRATDQWAGFAVAFCALSVSYLVVPYVGRVRFSQPALAAIGLSGLAAIGVQSIVKNATIMRQYGLSMVRIKPATDWLLLNAKPGEVVYHPYWAMFTELFFWNKQNLYIGGMDPIFQYAYDRDKYWRSTRLGRRQAVATTSPTPLNQNAENSEDTYTVLRRDFNASYMVLSHKLNPDLIEWAKKDPRFETLVDDREIALFRLLTPEQARKRSVRRERGAASSGASSGTSAPRKTASGSRE